MSTPPRRPELTSAELELIGTDDGDIRKSVSNFSFDIEKLRERVVAGEWQNVIQAHLYLDHAISQLIVEHLPKPKALRLERVSVSQKLDLITAHALLGPDLVAVARALNGLRNKIAHDVDFELDDESCSAVLRRVPASLKATIEHDPFCGPGYSFGKLLVFLVLFIDVARMNLAGDRIIGRKAELKLRAVLNAADRTRATRRAPQ